MKRTITIRTWGGRGAGTEISGVPLTVRVGETRTGLDAAIARIDRELADGVGRGNRAAHVIQASSQGTSMENGIPESNHYQLTLGSPAPGGGSNVDGTLWIAVPVGTGLGRVGYRG
jgi:ethanolamine utilization microcompartment shell protein EutL